MDEILAHMKLHGIQLLPSIPLVLDGVIHRFVTNTSGKDGWYVGNHTHMDGQDYIWITYGDWSKNIVKTYLSHQKKLLPLVIRDRWKKLNEISNKEQEKQESKSKEVIRELLSHAKHADPLHIYLCEKHITIYNDIYQYRHYLLIPVYDFEEGIVSAQYIFPDGKKRFHKHISIKNRFWTIGDVKNVIYLTESFANAASLYQVTKDKVFCSFGANNLFNIALLIRKKYSSIKIVIVADNDGENGIGQKCAYKVCDYIDNVRVIVPELMNHKKCDINNVYTSLGEQGVLSQLKQQKDLKVGSNISCSNSLANQWNDLDLSMNATNIIHNIISYYNKTSFQNRPGFALQTALAFCSVILARKYKTDYNHHPSLYFLNIGRSGSGKEHQLTVIHELLDHVSHPELLGSSGYTSPGAIMSALMANPSHISLIDEFGDYLISLNDKRSNQRLVNRCLLQLFGRCNGSYLGEQYSKFNKGNNESDRIIIKNPALTLLAAVQPSKFYSNINSGLIDDGFLGRFLIYECDLPNEPIHLKKRSQPDLDFHLRNIKAWVDKVDKRFFNNNRNGAGLDYALSPNFITIQMDADALLQFNEFSDYITHELLPKLDSTNVSELVSRWAYMSASLSLIFSVARDPSSHFIKSIDISNAIKIIKTFGENFVFNVIDKINTTQYENDKNEFLLAIQAHGNNGITSRDLARKKPFYRFPRRERLAIIEDLIESELIVAINDSSGKGRNTITYCAVQKISNLSQK